jgi:uncharacterized protein (TIGR03066 family)
MKKKPERWWITLKQAVDREMSLQHGPRRQQGDANVQGAATVEADGKPRAGARNWRVWLFLLLCLVGSAVASFVIFKYVAPTIPHELIGKWKVTDGPLKDATLEFRWYGTAIATANNKGKEETTESSVKVVGNKILLTSTHAVTGKEDTVSQTILKLTEDELVLRDEDRMTYAMKRVRN